jgi:hypothetical protein
VPFESKLPWVDRHVYQGRNQDWQLRRSETCVPVTVMNAERQARGTLFRDPDAVLQHLNRVGPTTRFGTSNLGMRRQAAALGMEFVPLGHDLEGARAMQRDGSPIAADINPGQLPARIQYTRGGPFANRPASHEVLIEHIDPAGNANVVDPQLGQYSLRRHELGQAVGPSGSLKALPPMPDWWWR